MKSCKHLEKARRNALYASKAIQNEMISVVASTIENKIIKEIQDAKLYILLADKVTEQLSVALRFVDVNKQI